jgi:soluble lytic murein transglycosylase-like protein
MYKDLENKFFGAKGTFSLSSMLYLNQSQYGNNLSLYGQDRLRLMEEIYDSAIEFEVDPHLAFCIITVESAWDTDAKSEAGAIGLMGIMPSTARLMERTIKTGELYDPFRNVVLGVQWFGKLRILNANNNVAALNEYWCGNGIENNTAYSSKVLGLTKKMKEGKL